MSYAIWSDDYRTGIEIIDQQHQQLFTILNRFLELASHDTPDVGSLSVLFENLRNFAHSHFSTEEEMMRAKSYPDRERHEAEHQLFREKFSAFEIALLTGLDVDEQIPAFLLKWIGKHIKETDFRLAAFLKQDGSAPAPS